MGRVLAHFLHGTDPGVKRFAAGRSLTNTNRCVEAVLPWGTPMQDANAHTLPWSDNCGRKCVLLPTDPRLQTPFAEAKLTGSTTLCDDHLADLTIIRPTSFPTSYDEFEFGVR